ncbi:MAG TPA: DNA-binding response regulator [Desulfotomaculum sp.]|nr:MAG: hypothetical protein VR67_08215 [Peptococcaceae bacterium BRH_c8a]KJS78612.1 MAG: hypothetical protein JL56_00865 [Desulfotomaculum sp. BICA1-6]HBX22086.1 DNA-binding response regulator [Desulfotomaculum sp.]
MSSINLMIVDDHPMIREGLVAMLSTNDDIIVVGSCGDAEEASRMALAQSPDIILMDIKMEGNNGIEAAKLILKNQPDIKIIFLTVFEDTEFVRQGLQAGAAGYILKHVSREKLVDSIQRVHRGETIIDPAVFNRIVNDYIKYSKSNEKQEQPEDTTPTVELTPREREILHFLVKGMTNKEISAATHLAVDTIKTHLRNIFRKMGIKNRSQAITQGLKLLKIDQG